MPLSVLPRFKPKKLGRATEDKSLAMRIHYPSLVIENRRIVCRLFLEGLGVLTFYM